jgi:predicted membrane metal-binding protein
MTFPMQAQNSLIDTLQHHLDAVMPLLARKAAMLDRGQAAMLAESADLRAQLQAVLGAYQVFKHDIIFDPAIRSNDAERTMLAREMKVNCIAAGEAFRRHVRQWTPEQIGQDWAGYVVAARLTLEQLHRHIDAERSGITELLRRYGG